MKVLIATDKYKDALSAHGACQAIREGLLEAGTSDCNLAPLTDGGEGFASILTESADGQLSKRQAPGPRFEPVDAHFGTVDLANIPTPARKRLALNENSKLALVEMAQASGIEQVPSHQRDPLQTTTAGTGYLLSEALASGAQQVLLGIGGSATNDLGLGALEALGLEALDAAGHRVTPLIPARFSEIADFAIGALPSLDLRIACDVDNPLLGKRGATRTFGPQKGLPAEALERVDALIGETARKLARACGASEDLLEAPGMGAAGGIACGLSIVLDARLIPGFELVSEWLALEAKLADCDLLITGEGRFDTTSLSGKGPGTLIREARARGKSVLVLAGSVEKAAVEAVTDERVRVQALSPEGEPLELSLLKTRERLQAAARDYLAS